MSELLEGEYRDGWNAEQKRSLNVDPVRMPIPGPELPTARVHGARAPDRVARLALVMLVLVACGGGLLLHRIDTAEQWAHVARSEARLARAEARRAAMVHRDVKPPNVVDGVCRRRTVAIRGALLALVRTGAISIPNDPGAEWITWR